MPPVLHRPAEAGRLRRSDREVREALRPPQGRREELNLDPAQRERLLAGKLRALAGEALDLDVAETAALPFGAASTVGDHAVVLVHDAPSHQLGPALAWASGRDATALAVLVDAGPDAEVLARRAALFDFPVDVLAVTDRSAQPAAPAPTHRVAPPPDGVDSLVEVIRASGAEVVVEHGVVTAEILGLEVGRVVVSESGPRLEVGVGRHDREAFAMLHGDLPAPEALARAVTAVQEARSLPTGAHPLRRLAPERRLRRVVLADPALVGAERLAPAEGTLVRESLTDRAVAVAVGEGPDGAVVVGCTVGLDLDAVPSLADARAAHAPTAELRLALPERDRLDVVERLLGMLADPGIAVGLPADLA